jgi:SAM-dependent methyltransferase
MILGRFIRDLSRSRPVATPAASLPTAADDGRRKVLNVGGNNKAIAIPSYFDGWDHLLLDIDPTVNADVTCDARDLVKLPAQQFDAVYCSHNLEHYYRHDGRRVLEGFRHVLKPEGFVDIKVPDMAAVMQRCIAGDLDIDDVLYTSPSGPITVHDVFYGWGKQIERSGVDFFAHKAGFTQKSLARFLQDAGFEHVFVADGSAICEIAALAFMQAPTPEQRRMLNL